MTMQYLYPLVLVVSLMAPHTRPAVAFRTEVGPAEDPTTCISFEVQHKDSLTGCRQFLANQSSRAILVSRAESLIYDMAQTHRFLSDRLTQDSSALAKLWHGSKLGSSKSDRSFFEGAVQSLPEVFEILSQPAKEIRSKLPAGSMPIVAEVWNRGTTATFLGEAGLPLVAGEYDMPLRSNKHRGSVKAQGNVHVSLEVAMSEIRECQGRDAEAFGLKCKHIAVTAKCTGAVGLRTGSAPKPYCKFRMKKNALTPSVKETGDVGEHSDATSATFPDTSSFFEWEEFAVQPLRKDETDPTPPVNTYVPWTLDELTVPEQGHAMSYYLAKEVFLNKEKCSRANLQWICRAIDQFGTLTIDRQSMDRLKRKAESEAKDVLNEDRQEMNVEDAGSALLEDAQWTYTESPIIIAAVVGAQHGARGGSLGGGGLGGFFVTDDEKPGPGTWLFVAVLLVVCICSAL